MTALLAHLEQSSKLVDLHINRYSVFKYHIIENSMALRMGVVALKFLRETQLYVFGGWGKTKASTKICYTSGKNLNSHRLPNIYDLPRIENVSRILSIVKGFGSPFTVNLFHSLIYSE